MTASRHPQKSGQAIIFLMVVMVIGLLVVVWNFDLHRVISAKLRMRNAGDAAALAAARWQGHILNMIGDLNLIQAVLIADADVDPDTGEVEIPPEVYELHDLRVRLDFAGPLAAFSVAQQTAFNNGALPDPVLASNLLVLAEDIRDEISRTPYDNAFDEYADLLESLVAQGVAVGSFGIDRLRHPLTQEGFYAAIAQSLADWWCLMRPYDHWLENYEDYGSWPKLDTEFRHILMFDMMLDEYVANGLIPSSALAEEDEFNESFGPYLRDTYPNGDFNFYEDGIGWHVYGRSQGRYSWDRPWPRPAEYDDVVNHKNLNRLLAVRERVKSEYNYLGAVAGITMSAAVDRGILSSSDNMTVDLAYRAKAKVFGFLNIEDGLVPPNYFGFVLPCFDDVRLVPYDVGYKPLSGAFYDHITNHLEPYLDGGPEATNPQCSYCRLLVAWENLDRQKGLEWLERAYNDEADNPCDPDIDSDNVPWGDDGGGATGGT